MAIFKNGHSKDLNVTWFSCEPFLVKDLLMSRGRLSNKQTLELSVLLDNNIQGIKVYTKFSHENQLIV